MKIFAKRLKELREERGYTRIKLAREINISQSTIIRIEKGDANIRMQTLIKIVLYFKLSSDYILGRTEDE